MTTHAAPDAIRARFAAAMSAMYRAEVPLYGRLIELVEGINADALARDPALAERLERTGERTRLGAERHGAIRVGTAEELALLGRAFAVMGMAPVGYYDLAPAGVPVHSTAFRATGPEALAASPFRMFTSLLRLELIEDGGLRAEAAAILARRRILSDEAIALIERHEREGGLTEPQAERFVAELTRTFRWREEARVDAATYARLAAQHRLVADVVSFAGPHINHLTPRTLDIDAAQAAMAAAGMKAKATIEGPPRRRVPILLRQTSFHALEEPIRFHGQAEPGAHTARFGEIEQRGAALTPKGRALYDRLLADANAGGGGLAEVFAAFPDDLDTLRSDGLAYFRYADVHGAAEDRAALDAALAAGRARADPIVYEDFLPVSAAGIFQSNLGGAEQARFEAASAQPAFEEALGRAVVDPFALYAAAEQHSLSPSG